MNNKSLTISESVVTPAMEEAGLKVLKEFCRVDEILGVDSLLVADIYRAMLAASSHRQDRQPTSPELVCESSRTD